MNKGIDSRTKKAKLTATKRKIAEYISEHYYNVCLTSALALGGTAYGMRKKHK